MLIKYLRKGKSCGRLRRPLATKRRHCGNIELILLRNLCLEPGYSCDPLAGCLAGAWGARWWFPAIGLGSRQARRRCGCVAQRRPPSRISLMGRWAGVLADCLGYPITGCEARGMDGGECASTPRYSRKRHDMKKGGLIRLPLSFRVMVRRHIPLSRRAATQRSWRCEQGLQVGEQQSSRQLGQASCQWRQVPIS